MALEASMTAQKRGAVYNICDDMPAPPEDVIAYGAELLGLPIPPAIAFEQPIWGRWQPVFIQKISGSRMTM